MAEKKQEGYELTVPEKADMSIGIHGLIPNSFEALYRMSKIMSASGLMPQGIQTPEAVFVAVQMGLEVGLSPMQAVQNIAVVNGRPSIWGDAALGLVRASGRLEYFAESFDGTFPDDNYQAICSAHRTGEDKATVRTFSIADAKRAELWIADSPNLDWKKRQTPWYKYPKRMLQMRARSWALRDGFTDILKGLKMAEEVFDYEADMVQAMPGTGTFEPEKKEEPVEDLEARLLNGDKLPLTKGEESGEVVIDLRPKTKNSKISAVDDAMYAAATEPDPDNNNDTGTLPQGTHLDWNPLEDEVRARYSKPKSELLKKMLEDRNIEYRKSWAGPQLHDRLLKWQERLKQSVGQVESPGETTEPGEAVQAKPDPEPDPASEPEATPVSQGNSIYFHDAEQIAAMSPTLQNIYGQMAERNNCLSEEISPKAVNSLIKRTYPDQWESARDRLKFGKVVGSDDAADRWNDVAIALVDDGMKV